MARDSFESWPHKVDGEHLHRGLDGRVSSIGSRQVLYGLDGRPSKIGGEDVHYGLDGRLQKIGDDEVRYGLTGQVLSVGEWANPTTRPPLFPSTSDYNPYGTHPDPVAKVLAEATVYKGQLDRERNERARYRAGLAEAPIWVATGIGALVGAGAGAAHYAALVALFDHDLFFLITFVLGYVVAFTWMAAMECAARWSREGRQSDNNSPFALLSALAIGVAGVLGFVHFGLMDKNVSAWVVVVPSALVGALIGHFAKAGRVRRGY